MQVILPYTEAEFTPEVRVNFRIGIAHACSAGCTCVMVKDDVNITSVSKARRRGFVGRPPDTRHMNRRQGENEGIRVDLEIGGPQGVVCSRLFLTAIVSDTANVTGPRCAPCQEGALVR